MKGKINKAGYLLIWRKAKMVVQDCPYAGFNGQCGDQCPLFGEPETVKHQHLSTGPTGETHLSLCNRTLTFEELIDERKK